MKVFIFTVFAILILTSCGRSQEEKERAMDEWEKMHDPAYQEQNNPSNYLSIKGEIEQPLFSRNYVKAQLTSSATMTIYKNIIINVNFQTKTGVILKQKDFTFYEYIRPYEKKSLEITIGDIPSETNKWELTVKSAQVASPGEIQ